MTEKLPPQPWERQHGESAKSYHAFCIYRDLGPARSIQKVADALCEKGLKKTKNPGAVKTQSSKHHWVNRVIAWEEEKDRIAREEEKAELKKMIKRHSQTVLTMQDKLIGSIESINPADLTAGESIKHALEIMKFERTIRGVPEKIIEQQGAGSSAAAAAFWIDEIPDVEKEPGGKRKKGIKRKPEKPNSG